MPRLGNIKKNEPIKMVEDLDTIESLVKKIKNEQSLSIFESKDAVDKEPSARYNEASEMEQFKDSPLKEMPDRNGWTHG